jgi:hypothetical protein
MPGRHLLSKSNTTWHSSSTIRSSCFIALFSPINLPNVVDTAASGVANTILAQWGGLCPSHSAQLIPTLSHLSFRSSRSEFSGIITIVTPVLVLAAGSIKKRLFPPPVRMIISTRNCRYIIDPRYEWSIFSGPRIQTLPSQLLIGSKKDAAVSRGRIHVTNFKILEHQNIIHVPFC